MLGEIWKIGDWSVFPAENTLRRDGSEVKVPPRLMDAAVKRRRNISRQCVNAVISL